MAKIVTTYEQLVSLLKEHGAGRAVDEAQPVETPEAAASEVDRFEDRLLTSLGGNRHPRRVVTTCDLEVRSVASGPNQHDSVAKNMPSPFEVDFR